MSEKRRAQKIMRIDDDIDRFLLRQMQEGESRYEALRRLLGIDKDERREEDRRDGRRAS